MGMEKRLRRSIGLRQLGLRWFEGTAFMGDAALRQRIASGRRLLLIWDSQSLGSIST
jgi:hypothetical protein